MIGIPPCAWHSWELIDYRSETIREPYQPLRAAYKYWRCIDCGIRKLKAEGQPEYLISDDGIEAA